VAVSGFPSPLEAQLAVESCLAELYDRRHLGSFGTGAALSCCDDGGVLRIETNGMRAPAGAQTLAGHGCKHTVVTLAVTSMTCFQSVTNSGKAVADDEMSAAGQAVTASWWEAYERLSCCAAVGDRVRFVDLVEMEPAGGCVQWMMTLEANVFVCACHGSFPTLALG
jgi:hypothetical protein